MRTKILFAALTLMLFSGLFSACIKEGDLDGLHNPIHLQGTFDPNLGVPIGSAQLSVGDMMSMLNGTEGYVQIESGNIVAIKFDTNFSNHIDINKKNIKGAGDTAAVLRNLCTGAVNVDLFSNISDLPSEDDLMIRNVFVNMVSQIKANANPSTVTLFEQSHITAVIDSIHLQFVDHNGQRHPIELADSSFTIPADELTGVNSPGYTLHLLDDEDVSYIINYRPKKIEYSFVFKFIIPTDIFSTDIMTFLQEEIGINSVDIHSNFNVRFPLSIYLKDLAYDIDLKTELSDSTFAVLDQYDITLNESHLYLRLSNRLPLGFDLKVSLLDENESTLCYLLNGEQAVIPGAHVSLNPAFGTYTPDMAQDGLLDILLNQQLIDALKQAKKIRIHSVVKTSNSDRSDKPMVSITTDDALAIHAYLQLHPSIDIDIPV